MNKANTIIIDNCIDDILSSIPKVSKDLDETGNLFCLTKTDYDENGDVIHDFMDIIDLCNKQGLFYINTIICINPTPQINCFQDNILYLVWFAKNINKQFFCKDPIRESHIWEKVEWGKRAKNYNPKGKDPGNVWIPTEDDGKAHIINHILLRKEDIFNRVVAASLQGDNTVALLYTYDTSLIAEKIDVRVNITFTGRKNNEAKKKSDNVLPLNDIPTNIQSQVIFQTAEQMNQLQDASVSCVVTSPPYWDLKDYFKKGQIGQESYETYINRMETVWRQCYNKLTPEGSMWININIRRHDNNVILIPRDIVKSCKKIGLHYKGIVIWHKSSGIPTHARNLVDRHEYVLVFSKSDIIHINTKHMKEFSDYKNPLMNGGAIWNINRKAGSVGKHFIHPAIYPNSLVERIVSISTNKGQLVLDPFLGSGTTLIASEKCDRRCVGYEFNEGFKELIQTRIAAELGKTVSVPFL